jgi:hypothetical protein
VKPSADDLWTIWNGGRARALFALLRGGTSAKEREEILYLAWSEAIGRMMIVTSGEGGWENLTKEQRIDFPKSNVFSFRNFLNSIFDAQFGLTIEDDLTH